MKIFKFTILFLITIFIPFNFINADEMIERIRGRILLQKDVRMAWYINPGDILRYRLGSANDVLEVMQKLGLGISNKDFDYFDNIAPKKLSGKILIKVEDSGKAYYVNPVDLKIHSLGSPQNALFVLRELGLGINDGDLEKIKIFKDDDKQQNENSYEVHSTVSEIVDKELVNQEDLQKSISTEEKILDVNGIYLTASTFRNINIEDFIERNKNSLLNTVVVDVAGFGLLSYKESEKNAEALEMIKRIQQLKDAGFYFIARVVALKSTHLASISPFKTRWGGVWDGVWVDGSSDEIKEYYSDIVTRLAKIGVDEIQLDYIRFPTEFFSRQTPATREERTKIITDLVSVVYAQTQQEGIKLSIDVFGILAWNEADNIKRLGQDVLQLIDHVDYLSPMIYPSHFTEGFGGFVKYDDPYTTIKVSTEKFVKLIGEENKGKLRPWLQGFSYRAPNFNSNYIYAQVKALNDIGINDFLIWNASNQYAPTHGMFAYLKQVKENK